MGRKIYNYLTIVLFLITTTHFTSLGSVIDSDCGDSCFGGELISVTEEGNCTTYEMKIYTDGVCSHGLSHVTVDVPCGTVTSASSTTNFPLVLNEKDPKTGYSGIKVDEIRDFGEEDIPQSFILTFTVCEATCEEATECWSPKLAFKAGQCIYEEVAEQVCTEPLTGSIESSDVECFNTATGTASVNIEGGISPYSFTWSDGKAGQTRSDLAAGEYSVTVTDSGGEELTLSTVINSPDDIIVSGQVQQPGCSASNAGSIDLSVSGGVSPYSFEWSTGETSANISGLSSGNYSVLITDANQCSVEKTFTIEESTSTLLITGTSTDASCDRSTLGTIDITVSGGSGDYNFNWNNGETTEDLSGLDKGYYTVNVTDASGCTAEATFAVRDNNTISLYVEREAPSCTGEPTGRLSAIVSGGTEPYLYEWSNGATTREISGLAQGSYSVTVTDAAGCSKSFSTYLRQDFLRVSADITTAGCDGSSTGSISLTPTNGTAPFEYSWSDGSTGSTRSGLAAGEYVATITDASGCATSIKLNVPTQSGPTVSLSLEKGSCDLAEATITAYTSSTDNLTYEWSDGSTGESITITESGIYSVTVTNSSGCSTTQSINAESVVNDYNYLCDEIQGGQCLVNDFTYSLSTDISSISITEETSGTGWTFVNNGSDIVITPGDSGTTATYTFTITTNDGCVVSCTKTYSSCVRSDSTDDGTDEGTGDGTDDGTDGGTDDGSDGGTDDGSDGGTDNGSDGGSDDGSDGGTDDGSDGGTDDGSDEGSDGGTDDGTDGGTDSPDDGDNNDDPNTECTSDFETIITGISSENGCYVIDFEIIADPDTKYGLSHITIDIPCAENAKIEFVGNKGTVEYVSTDPTTGATGIKIENFGDFKSGSYTFSVTYCETESCPEIGEGTFEQITYTYKAGQCVTSSNGLLEIPEIENSASIYPNPSTNGQFNIALNEDYGDEVQINIYTITGDLLLSKQMITTGKELLDINIPDKPGQYMIQIIGTEISDSQIIIIE
ncbi:T9SS type A sorting domain-containing protein [Mangrovivirga cuniculi]|uniref:Secretion system C-terminal sorting domain-containing protein n=1 Tax=Mangrovivirga cuniculi TaxID=2715131 RepID=A0A4D7K416_9BACT|nr:T9SS type A sorting domain-containing protein [Mangrovivirga cuniculi]QCK15554.1 hypothetical protein DCC35_12750 [Mangrovivirga cuniculi]